MIGCKKTVHRAGQSLGERYIELFNGELRDELLNREVFDILTEAKVLIER